MTSKRQAEFTPIRRTAMHQKHLVLGASLVNRDGWQQAARFDSVDDEAKLLRDTVGIYDISPKSKFGVKGDRLVQFISEIFSESTIPNVTESNITRIKDEKVTLCRLAEDEILCLAAARSQKALAEALKNKSGQCAHTLELTSGLAGIGIVGPRATRLLSMISELNTSDSDFTNLCCAQSKFADIHGVVLRTDIGDLPGYQLYCGREFGEYLWEALMQAADVCGGGPVGFEACDALTG